MKLPVTDKLWTRIYYRLRGEQNRIYGDYSYSRIETENFLKEYGVNVITDFEGRWEEVEFAMSDEELTIFLMKYGT